MDKEWTTLNLLNIPEDFNTYEKYRIQRWHEISNSWTKTKYEPIERRVELLGLMALNPKEYKIRVSKKHIVEKYLLSIMPREIKKVEVDLMSHGWSIYLFHAGELRYHNSLSERCRRKPAKLYFDTEKEAVDYLKNSINEKLKESRRKTKALKKSLDELNSKYS